MKYYSTIKRTEVLTHVTAWMVNLEGITPSETSHTQKDKYCKFHLYEMSRIDKFIEIEVTRGWRKQE